MTVLFIGPIETDQAAALVAFASMPENHYRLNSDSIAPGADSRYCLHLGEFRCVFSYTDAKEEGIFKHLSVSIPSPNRWPHPAAIELLGQLFGFKGKLSDWLVRLNKDEHCIVIAQKIETP